jgi:hypothetical protein
MLVSHTHRFVFTKTRKTAGTSVEIYFEPYCVDPAAYEGPRHFTAQMVSRFGIVGFRGADPRGCDWFNHMPAARIRDQLGEAAWNAYFKFCTVRNPFDKVVSMFWMDIEPAERRRLARADFAEVRRAFGGFAAERAGMALDRATYSIGQSVAVDHVIRHEALLDGLEEACRRTGVPFEPERLGRYKGDARVRPEPFGEYYDAASRAAVLKTYAFEFEVFGYPRD